MQDFNITDRTLLDYGLGHLSEPVAAEDPGHPNEWVNVILKYRYDPVGFCRDLLGVEPFPWQIDAMTRVSGSDPVRRLSCCSGHGVGKTAFVSWIAVHKLVCYYPIKIICTAPSAATLESNLLPEIKIWINKLPDFIRDNFEVRSDKIVLGADPDAAFIQARTSSADRPEALAGIHADNVLIIVDEASGVPQNVFDVAAGSMSSKGAQTVLISNPTRLTGLFYESQHRLARSAQNPDGVWDTIHVSCLDLVGDPNRPEQVTPDFVREMRETHGEESNEFRIRVLGRFATSEDSTLIGADLVEAAMERDVELNQFDSIVYGLDVARFGDDRSVLCKRQGNVVVDILSWKKLDTTDLIGRVLTEAKQDNPAEIVVDTIGVGGPVADRLRELGLNVRDCNVSESPSLNSGAERLRDELWVRVRDWLRERKCKLPKMDQLRTELIAPTYTYTSAGKMKVEGKDSLKKRIKVSPDYADALCLTFASDETGAGGRGNRWIPGVPMRRRIPQMNTIRRRF